MVGTPIVRRAKILARFISVSASPFNLDAFLFTDRFETGGHQIADTVGHVYLQRFLVLQYLQNIPETAEVVIYSMDAADQCIGRESCVVLVEINVTDKRTGIEDLNKRFDGGAALIMNRVSLEGSCHSAATIRFFPA